MTETAIEMKDPSRMRCLVMPSPRALPSARATLGPIEMAARSIQFPPPAPAAATLATASGGNSHTGQARSGGAKHGLGSNMVMCGEPSSSSVSGGVTVPGWFVPGTYGVCGLCLGLCNLVAPAYIQACCHALCPVWSLAFGLHLVWGKSQSSGGGDDDGLGLWVWVGLLCFCLLPFVILVGHPLFAWFYLLVFGFFSTGVWWGRLHGAHFILVCLCWAGFVLSSGFGFGTVPLHMHMSVAAFFAISLGLVNAGCSGGAFSVRVAG